MPVKSNFAAQNIGAKWTISQRQYVRFVRRYVNEIGRLNWAAPMDRMCEPFMLMKTGLTVKRHQQKTVDNYIALRSLAPDLSIIPVVQGWTLNDVGLRRVIRIGRSKSVRAKNFRTGANGRDAGAGENGRMPDRVVHVSFSTAAAIFLEYYAEETKEHRATARRTRTSLVAC